MYFPALATTPEQNFSCLHFYYLPTALTGNRSIINAGKSFIIIFFFIFYCVLQAINKTDLCSPGKRKKHQQKYPCVTTSDSYINAEAKVKKLFPLRTGTTN
ncbi:MAG: hypothetical protein BGP14_00435 [Sphingobacteriales bacterium 44-15]|nr:MAG: hypothetical protein BGP14_00435 [Sphingobacteriales bacterium 44-15]